MMNAEQLSHALGGKRSGRQYVAKCPAHPDGNPSLLIFDGHDAVQLRCLSGCSPLDVIDALKARGLWEVSKKDPPLRTVSRNTPQLRTPPSDDGEAHSALALRIWEEGVEPTGTLAEVYLWNRELVLPVKPMHVIRFHPECPRGKGKQPALIALMRELELNRPRAIQRIFLTPDAKKDGAQMLGPVGGCAMKLTSNARTFWDAMDYCPRLHVCEGLETGLALLRDGYNPTWALGSAGAIERLTVIFGVGDLVICADNDDAGMNAAFQCMQHWNGAKHHRAIICTPDLAGQDFADIPGGS